MTQTFDRSRVFAAAALLLAGACIACNKSPADKVSTNAAGSSAPAAVAADKTTYQARGTIKAFGEGRKSLKISHEDIPGYMKAMTMPFAVTSTNELDGLKEGDAVDFSFTEQPDGRLLIQSIKKR